MIQLHILSITQSESFPEVNHLNVYQSINILTITQSTRHSLNPHHVFHPNHIYRSTHILHKSITHFTQSTSFLSPIPHHIYRSTHITSIAQPTQFTKSTSYLSLITRGLSILLPLILSSWLPIDLNVPDLLSLALFGVRLLSLLHTSTIDSSLGLQIRWLL